MTEYITAAAYIGRDIGQAVLALLALCAPGIIRALVASGSAEIVAVVLGVVAVLLLLRALVIWERGQ